MTRWLILLLVVSLCAAIVVASGQALPATVASHFGPEGRADGFMSRDVYVAFMAAIVVAVPLLIALGGALARWLPSRLVNLPNKDYWLAPERRAQAVSAMEVRMIAMACALAIFLCYVHWLVVQANAAAPPRLDEARFIAALAAFVIFALGWSAAFYLRFRRPAGATRRQA